MSVYPPSSQQVSFYYYTSDGSAVSPSDYLSIQSTFVSLNPGQTNVSITVQVNGDFNIEPDEMFYLYIYSLNNANYVNSQAVGTIVNDDGLQGQVDHFAWEPIPSPQYSGAPFSVSVTALDPSNVLVTNFTGAVTIIGYPGVGGPLITVDELGNGDFNGAPLPSGLKADPFSGIITLAYQLPFPGVPGDVQLFESGPQPSAPSCRLRLSHRTEGSSVDSPRSIPQRFPSTSLVLPDRSRSWPCHGAPKAAPQGC